MEITKKQYEEALQLIKQYRFNLELKTNINSKNQDIDKLNFALNVKSKVCEYYNLDVNDITSRYRGNKIPDAKKMVSYILYFGKTHRFTLTEIASINGLDHSTVYYHINTIKDFLSIKDKSITEAYESIKFNLNGK